MVRGTGFFLPRIFYGQEGAKQRSHDERQTEHCPDGSVAASSGVSASPSGPQQRSSRVGACSAGTPKALTGARTCATLRTLHRVPWGLNNTSSSSSSSRNGLAVGSCPVGSVLLSRPQPCPPQTPAAGSPQDRQAARSCFNRSSSCGNDRSGPTSFGRSSCSGGSTADLSLPAHECAGNAWEHHAQLPAQPDAAAAAAGAPWGHGGSSSSTKRGHMQPLAPESPGPDSSSSSSLSGSTISLLTYSHSNRAPHTPAAGAGAAASPVGASAAPATHELWGPQSCGGSPLSGGTALATMSDDWATDLLSTATAGQDEAALAEALLRPAGTAIQQGGTLIAVQHGSAVTLGSSPGGVTFMPIAGALSADALPCLQQQQPSASTALLQQQQLLQHQNQNQQLLLLLPASGGPSACAAAAAAGLSNTAALADTLAMLEQQLAAACAASSGPIAGNTPAAAAAAPSEAVAWPAAFSSAPLPMQLRASSYPAGSSVPTRPFGVPGMTQHWDSHCYGSSVDGCGSNAFGSGLCVSGPLCSFIADTGSLLGTSPNAVPTLLHANSSQPLLGGGSGSSSSSGPGMGGGNMGWGLAAAASAAGGNASLPGPLGASSLMVGQGLLPSGTLGVTGNAAGTAGSAMAAAQMKLQQLVAVEQMQQQLQVEFLRLLPLI